MKVDVLLYVEDNISDDDLLFNNYYLPDKLKETIKDITVINEIYYCIPKVYSGKLQTKKESFIRTENDDIKLWKKIFSALGSDHIVKIFCDSAFLDISLIKDMIDLHIKFLAEFTYSENLPSGYSSEIVSRELINEIPESEEKMLPLSTVIRSNINQFDVELYYKEPDIRGKRISFRSSVPSEKKIMENIYNKLGKIPGYDEINNILNNNPDLIFVGPSYIDIELTGRCNLNCLFCYRMFLDETHSDMEIDLYKKILTNMKSFQLPYSIAFGGSGEPMMHNNFYMALELALNESLIENIVIETNGIFADNNFKNFLLSYGNSKIKTIFNINGMDEKTYTAIHKENYFNTVFQNITSLRDVLTDEDSIYIQIMKINETEETLDKYYDFWEKYKIPIILQKQNTFLGKIEDRRYSDLSPIERFPCWHLQRDMSILSNGVVSFCKQDINGDSAKGNIKNDSLLDIWLNSKKHFIQNYFEKHPTKPDCKLCDEWYTYNL